jgi:hypothetical protein
MANPLCFSSWVWLRTTPRSFNSWPFTKLLGLVLKQDDTFQKFNHPDLLSDSAAQQACRHCWLCSYTTFSLEHFRVSKPTEAED